MHTLVDRERYLIVQTRCSIRHGLAQRKRARWLCVGGDGSCMLPYVPQCYLRYTWLIESCINICRLADHGGPLAGGDIEELGGQPCVVCPWHRYKISLVTGEGMYIGIDPMQKGPDGKPQQLVKSKGVKQRIHPTKIKSGWLYIKDSAEKMYKNFISKDISDEKKEEALISAAEAFKQAAEGKANVDVSSNKGDSSARAVEAKQKINYEVASDEYAMDPFGVTTSGGVKLHSSK